ncbi:MAG TPA: PIN domain-containing protein, partial [Chloroflexota bacterium]|nr:PIN domain-containing protein [Chloroflexota bacterium]
AEAVHPLARQLFRRIAAADDPLSGYLSVITASELLVRPIRAGAADLTFMHAFLRGFPNLHVLAVDLDVALQAASIRALARLPLPDALLVASATLSRCEAIVTNDHAWHQRLRGHFRSFRWVYLAAQLRDEAPSG